MTLLPERVLWLFSRRYIAGRSRREALAKARELYNQGLEISLDVLGEDVSSPEQCEAYCDEYISLISESSQIALQISLSIKPSMLGMALDKEGCLHRMERIIHQASGRNLPVQIDMESSAYTDDELWLFQKLYTKYPAYTGIVLQAALHRSESDLETLIKLNQAAYPIALRICKGIYIEPESIAYTDKEAIRLSFLRLTDRACRGGLYPCIASHDAGLIQRALGLINKGKPGSGQYEIQMLYGVRPSLARALLHAGHRVRVYLPYGLQWRKYSLRRLRENPSMLWHIAKALIYRG